jgi:serine/threonine protein kinase
VEAKVSASCASPWRPPHTNPRYALYHTLETMHRRGVAHCDFEPRNIVRDPGGRVTIIDLDCAEAHKCQGFAMCTELRVAAGVLRISTRLAAAFEVLSQWTTDLVCLVNPKLGYIAARSHSLRASILCVVILALYALLRLV